MAYNYGFGTSKMTSTISGGSNNTAGGNFGRVVEVILDAFHPRYDEFNRTQSLNGVIYREVNKPKIEDEEEDLKFAYCQNSTFKRIPVKGEIVELTDLPSHPYLGFPLDYWLTLEVQLYLCGRPSSR